MEEVYIYSMDLMISFEIHVQKHQLFSAILQFNTFLYWLLNIISNCTEVYNNLLIDMYQTAEFPQSIHFVHIYERLWFGHKKGFETIKGSMNCFHFVEKLLHYIEAIFKFWTASPSPTVLYWTKCVTFTGIILKQQNIQRKRLLSSILEIIVQEPNDTILHPKTLSIIQNLRHNI